MKDILLHALGLPVPAINDSTLSSHSKNHGKKNKQAFMPCVMPPRENRQMNRQTNFTNMDYDAFDINQQDSEVIKYGIS